MVFIDKVLFHCVLKYVTLCGSRSNRKLNWIRSVFVSLGLLFGPLFSWPPTCFLSSSCLSPFLLLYLCTTQSAALSPLHPIPSCVVLWFPCDFTRDFTRLQHMFQLNTTHNYWNATLSLWRDLMAWKKRSLMHKYTNNKWENRSWGGMAFLGKLTIHSSQLNYKTALFRYFSSSPVFSLFRRAFFVGIHEWVTLNVNGCHISSSWHFLTVFCFCFTHLPNVRGAKQKRSPHWKTLSYTIVYIYHFDYHLFIYIPLITL